jgi:hypothetical protein
MRLPMSQVSKCDLRSTRAQWAFIVGIVLVFATSGVARADNMCAPAPVGVFGLTGAPDFWEQPAVTVGSPDLAVPAGFGQELDDPRWNTSWHYDFGSGGMSEAGMRALEDDTGHYLYLSFLVYADPNGASTADAIYLGLSDAAGAHGDLAKISLSGTDPLPALRNAAQTQVVTWWGTADGGTTWHADQNTLGVNCTGGATGPGPLCWFETSMVHVWTGAGTYAAAGSAAGTDNVGYAWAINARIDLTKVGYHLGAGGALARPYHIFSELSVAVPAGMPILYDWPSASSLSFDGSGLPVSSISGWGQANSDATTCAGIAVTDMSIGLTPVTTVGTMKIPATTISYGATNPANTFVAILSGSGGATVPPAGTVKARFQMANWGSVPGVGGTWNDILPAPFFSLPNGTAPDGNDTISWSCGGTSGNACPAFNPATQTADQCLLVELSKASSQPEIFVQDSARRNMDFVHASMFERSAQISVAGLTPLAGGGGARDVYIYVKTVNLSESGNAPPVPPPSLPSQSIATNAERQGPPTTTRTTYEQLALLLPTYEVHVYHDTGKTRPFGSGQVKVLEPQIPFGYLVQHQGSVDGWMTSLSGVGVTLEQIAPNFYHVKVPDNGFVTVHTTINTCGRLLGIIRCCCDVVGSPGGGPIGLAAVGVILFLLLARARNRRKSVLLES